MARERLYRTVKADRMLTLPKSNNELMLRFPNIDPKMLNWMIASIYVKKRFENA